MKALVKSHAKEGIWLKDVSEPDFGNNDVLIKIHKTARRWNFEKSHGALSIGRYDLY